MKTLFHAIMAFFRGAFALRRETGRSLIVWALVALFHLAAQVTFCRNFEPGEFATLNTVLGAVALLLVPLLALQSAFAWFQPRDPERLPAVMALQMPVVFNAVVAWAGPAALLMFPLLALLDVPRSMLRLAADAVLLVTLCACVSAAFYETGHRLRSWNFLLFLAGLARWLLAIGVAGAMPWAEAGLAVVALGGLILLAPILRQNKIAFAWKKALAIFNDREFLLYFGATFSVMLGLFLFSSGDRLIAQTFFGRAADNNLGLVHWDSFAGYQTAGLLGRALIWGTQPLLFILVARRTRLARTTSGLRNLFWGYLAVLGVGVLLLCALAGPFAHLFGGVGEDSTLYYLRPFALAMIPVGLLQGVGFFALASRRYPECFTLGASGLAYTVLLCFEGRPQLILGCVFGGSLVALMLVLFIGVVRWGRKNP